MADQKIVTVAISGGLGNQMFQYAAARALALRSDAEVRLDLSFYRRRRHRQFELDAFPIVAAEAARAGFWARIAGSRPAPRYREPGPRFDPALLELVVPVVLEGYFQSARYFEGSAEAIRRELAPPAAEDSESLAIAQAMRDAGSTALHVRRGDYVSNTRANATHGTCSVDYYRGAMERLPGDGPVFVFSDDIDWARVNLPDVRRLVFVGRSGPRSGLADLWLMTLAQHHIVANSSFSWWGAWLAEPGRGMRFAPARWFADTALDDADMVPPEWIRVPS